MSFESIHIVLLLEHSKTFANTVITYDDQEMWETKGRLNIFKACQPALRADMLCTGFL